MACFDMKVEGNHFSLTIAGELSRSLFKMEGQLQKVLNGAGLVVMEEMFKHLDTDGSDIEIGSTIYRVKNKISKQYHTPYGDIKIPRHVYQPSGGGATYCPMEHDGRLIRGNVTPFFAKQIFDKFARNHPREV